MRGGRQEAWAANDGIGARNAAKWAQLMSSPSATWAESGTEEYALNVLDDHHEAGEGGKRDESQRGACCASASARHLIVARLLLACKADRGGRTVEARLLMRCIFNAIACHQ